MSLKILAVDDSKTIRMIVKKAFKAYDCELLEAENGVEGLALAAKEAPDLIVLDITMPVMNGGEMLGKLKSENNLKDIQVIMLTAETGKDNVMRIVKMGVNDYIVKPFKGPELIDRVEKILTLEPKKEEETRENKSSRYFSADGDIQCLSVPEKVNRPVFVEVEGQVQAKIDEMKKAGMDKFILDLGKVTETNVSLIRLIVSIIQSCQKSNIRMRLTAGAALGEELKGFQETSGLPIHPTLEEAKATIS